MTDNEINIYGDKEFRLPIPEMYVLYTGDNLTIRKSEVVSLMMTLYDQAYAVDCYGKEQYNEGRKEGKNEGLNAGIRGSIIILKNMNVSRDDAINKIMSVYNLNKTDVDNIFKSYWI